MSWKFKVVPLTYTTDRDAWTLTLNNAGTLESLLSEGWSVVRTDVLPGLNGKGEYKVPPNTCFEPSLPPTLVYILGKEAEMMHGISRNKRRSPHACRSAVGIFICASNGIGPAQYEDSLRRIEHCVICGRWWKLYAASSHLTIWTELPEWVVWLLRHKTWKTMHNQKRKETK